MATSIYAIRHPETKEIRYIGKTKRRPSKRLCNHICEAKKQKLSTPVSKWIRKLLNAGLRPEIVTLLVVPNDCFDLYEKLVIRFYRSVSPGRMLNVSDGGDGAYGFSQGPKSDAFKQLMREKFAGIPLSEDTKLKMRGRRFTVEHRAKLAAAKAGRKMPDDHRLAISRSLKGKKKSLQHAANIRRGKANSHKRETVNGS